MTILRLAAAALLGAFLAFSVADDAIYAATAAPSRNPAAVAVRTAEPGPFSIGWAAVVKLDQEADKLAIDPEFAHWNGCYLPSEWSRHYPIAPEYITYSRVNHARPLTWCAPFIFTLLPYTRAQLAQPPFVQVIAELSPAWRAELYRRVR